MNLLPLPTIAKFRSATAFCLCLFVCGVLIISPARADLNDGIDAFEREDYETAAREMRPYAERGITMVEYLLGALYMYGEGVPKDYEEARKWLRLAADKELSEAQFALGYLYFEGLGVEQDYKKAEHWYRKSAEQGYVLAQVSMGELFFDGMGVSEDIEIAAYWYSLAASQGDVRSQYIIGLLTWGGVGGRQDQSLAYKWMILAADQGLEEAQDKLISYAEEMTSAEITKAERLADAWRAEHYSSENFWRRGFSSSFSRTLRELRELDIDE
jgi:TPR repeat protein